MGVLVTPSPRPTASKNSTWPRSHPGIKTSGDNFLFINRYSTASTEQSQLPDRQTIGSHVQRNLRKSRRRRILRQGSLANRHFNFTIRPKSTIVNDLQTTNSNKPTFHRERLHPAQRKKTVPQYPHTIQTRHISAMSRSGECGTPRQLYGSTYASAEEFESSRSNASSTVLQLPKVGTSEYNIALDYHGTEASYSQERLEGSNMIDRWLCPSTGVEEKAPYNSVSASVLEFYDKSHPYLQQSYLYKMIEHVIPGSATLWMQAQVQDAASLHGLYAASSAVAARLAPGHDAKMKLRTIARKYYIRSLMVLQVRIENGENLERIAYDTASLLVYTSGLSDWPSYRVHLDGMRHIVMLRGGAGSVNLTLRLLLLVGEALATTHMLIRSTPWTLEWVTPSWHEDPNLEEARHLFKIEDAQRHTPVPVSMMQPPVNSLLKETQDFHSILAQYCMSENALNALDNVRHWLTMQFFVLTQGIVNAYCDSSQNKLFRTQNDFVNSIEGLERAFLVALLCYHQCVYYAQTNPSLISSHHVPFRHIKKHLEQFTGNLEHLRMISSPEVLETLTWISFVGTYEEGLNEGDFIQGGTVDWSSKFCLQMISLQGTSVRTVNDLRTQLMKISYCDSVFSLSLHRVWDQAHRRKSPHMY